MSRPPKRTFHKRPHRRSDQPLSDKSFKQRVAAAARALRELAGETPRRGGFASAAGPSLPQVNIKKQVQSKIQEALDLQSYKDLFPLARGIKRTHTLLVGPTNSGKTYQALNLLTGYNSGAYLSPLRLLALEVQEDIEKRGKVCSLLTGEEQDIRENATFVSSTIELLATDTEVDAVLVDEAQLLSDPKRGWAWTQAIVGAPARHVIMTGSPECIPLIRYLVENYLGEELEVIEKQRMSALSCLKDATLFLEALEPGTAIIAFSRKKVLAIKQYIERRGRKVSVLYGNLSPSARREEARRFREGEADLLVATDCIGMGLNLPIKTVIFSTVSKFDGTSQRYLTPQEVKQIAGRAGRFGKFDGGTVGAFMKQDLKFVNEFLHAAPTPPEQAIFYIAPTFEQLAMIREHVGRPINLFEAISIFSKLQSEDFTSFDLNEAMELALRIEDDKLLSQLPQHEKFSFIFAPVSSSALMDYYLDHLRNFTNKQVTQLAEKGIKPLLDQKFTTTDEELHQAEMFVKKLTIYRWLARKHPKMFPDLIAAEELSDQLNTFIEVSLKQKNFSKRCMRCKRELSFMWPHRLCDECFFSGRR